MPRLYNKKVLPYDLHFLYNIITDIEKYDEFIPWCEKVILVEKEDHKLIADVTVKFIFIREHYRSIATLTPPLHNIENLQASVQITMLYGPFSHFITLWNLFKVEDSRTQIEFTCDFSFNKKLYNTFASAVLCKANHSILKAFEKRAAELISA
jgi:coenzyme Q-binding protein COQ10